MKLFYDYEFEFESFYFDYSFLNKTKKDMSFKNISHSKLFMIHY